MFKGVAWPLPWLSKPEMLPNLYFVLIVGIQKIYYVKHITIVS